MLAYLIHMAFAVVISHYHLNKVQRNIPILEIIFRDRQSNCFPYADRFKSGLNKCPKTFAGRSLDKYI